MAVQVRAKHGLDCCCLGDYFVFGMHLSEGGAEADAGVRRTAAQARFEQSLRRADGKPERARSKTHPRR